MTNGPRCKTNQRLREILGKRLLDIPLGINFTVGEIAAIMNTRRTPMDSRNVGRLLRERDDVEHVKSGVWRRTT